MVSTAAAADCGARGGVDIAGQALFLDLLQVFLPQFVVVLAQIVEHVPGIEAAVVPVRENQAQRIGADRFDTFDIDIALAGLQGFLTRAMTTGFSRRRVDAQIFEVEGIGLAPFINQLQASGFLVQFDFALLTSMSVIQP